MLDTIDFADVLPSIVNTLSWQGRVYALPYDGDIHYYSYRKDLLGDPAIRDAFEAPDGLRPQPGHPEPSLGTSGAPSQNTSPVGTGMATALTTTTALPA